MEHQQQVVIRSTARSSVHTIDYCSFFGIPLPSHKQFWCADVAWRLNSRGDNNKRLLSSALLRQIYSVSSCMFAYACVRVYMYACVYILFVCMYVYVTVKIYMTAKYATSTDYYDIICMVM